MTFMVQIVQRSTMLGHPHGHTLIGPFETREAAEQIVKNIQQSTADHNGLNADSAFVIDDNK